MGQIVSRPQMVSLCDRLRSQGQVIVFTNGCFDLLHVGRVRSLSQAKALGDVLIVGLNSEASIPEAR